MGISDIFKPSGSQKLSGDQGSITDLGTPSSSNSHKTEIGSIPQPNLKIKRVDYYWSKWSNEWKYKNTGSKGAPEGEGHAYGYDDSDPWLGYCFVVIRNIPTDDAEKGKPPTFKVVIKSRYLIKACQEVMKDVPSISWNTEPGELDPQLFIAFLPLFESYHGTLVQNKHASQEDKHVTTSVKVLIDYLRNDYKRTLGTIHNLTSHHEITYDLLYAILLPGATLVATCPVTDEPRAFQLVSTNTVEDDACSRVELIIKGTDAIDNMRTFKTSSLSKVHHRAAVMKFEGTIKITSLEVYPIEHHPEPERLKKMLIERGRRWAALNGVHHRRYNGLAGFKYKGRTVRYNVDGRIMIDRLTFKRLDPNYPFPDAMERDREYSSSAVVRDGQTGRDIIPNEDEGPSIFEAGRKQWAVPNELKDEDLLLASPVIYGYSLVDKMWLEFNVERISHVEWNDEAFENLILSEDRKDIVQALVEAHSRNTGFDDIIKGKGQGLIFNLFGPPGCGKTLTAEATSERVRRPLYVVGGGDLGVSAAELDVALEKIFDMATTWNAIVLIDEADVFMEERSSNDLARNAMVAVFLRHLEYYRGILFLTTNRVKCIDEAFRSRIHVALDFEDLDVSAKTHVWTVFLRKAGVVIGEGGVTQEQLGALADRGLNGRVIKNAVRTASSLAIGKKQTLGYTHIVRTLDFMNAFSGGA